MKAYILSVIGAVFLLDVAAMLIPSGKTGKTVTAVVRLGAVLIMLLPVVGVINGIRYAFGESSSFTADESYIDKSVEMQIEDYISENYGVDCDVKKISYIVTVKADKTLFPIDFEESLEAAFGEEITVVYEY